MPINARLPFVGHRLYKLRNILLAVMVLVLTLPLGGLYFFRIYENELVQQCERELIAQAAALAASYRLLARGLQTSGTIYGKFLPNLPKLDDAYQPIIPTLNLFDTIHPRRPNAMPTEIQADPIALKVGQMMLPILQNTQQVTLSGLRLLDMNGTVIAGREETGLSLAQIREVQQALQGNYASVIRQRISDQPPPPLYSISRGTLIRLFVAFPIIENRHLQGVLYLSRSPENILKHLYAVRWRVLAVSLVLLMLMVFLVIVVSATISRPIRELIRQTQRVRQGEQKQLEPIRSPITYEIANLSESFVEMAQALTDRSDYLRRFASHMSHEIKTPLTAMQGALELLHDHLDTMPQEQQMRFINNLLADALRLQQLVNRLLELAHADAIEPSLALCRLQDTINALQNRFVDRGLTIYCSGQADTTLLIGSEVLEMALYNLIENSLQHGADWVTIYTNALGTHTEVFFHDNGNGISEANRAKIFTPFFTTKRDTGGTGLGLAITASLLKAYKGRIELLPAEQGALFRISLPVVNS
jgi:signal transduction histidine kinase